MTEEKWGKKTRDGLLEYLKKNSCKEYFDKLMKTEVEFNWPNDVAIDSKGNIYIADSRNHCIKKVAPSGTLSIFAGSDKAESGNRDGKGTEARFSCPRGMAIDSNDSIYVADTDNNSIRRITPDGNVIIFADGFGYPCGVAIDFEGDIYVTDSLNHCIYRVTPDGKVSLFVGSGRRGEPGFQAGQGTEARFNYPYGITVDSKRHIYVTDAWNCGIYEITPGGKVDILARGLAEPTGIAIDSKGNIYISDSLNQCINKMTPSGTLSIFAGSEAESGNRDGKGTEARFSCPRGMAIDSNDSIYIADACNDRIRIATFEGNVRTMSTKVIMYYKYKE